MNQNACCFSGHRPEKLNTSETAIKSALKKEISAAINGGITVFISGMARGVDLWAAKLVLDFKTAEPNIQLLCALPYKNFGSKWKEQWRTLYSDVIGQADSIKTFYPSFTFQSFQERNRWMVDHSSRIIAVYNGSKGGTFNTLKYANKKKKEVCIIPD